MLPIVFLSATAGCLHLKEFLNSLNNGSKKEVTYKVPSKFKYLVFIYFSHTVGFTFLNKKLKQAIYNQCVASEVPTNDIYGLVTCGLFTIKRIFTLKPRNIRNKKKGGGLPLKYLVNLNT